MSLFDDDRYHKTILVIGVSGGRLGHFLDIQGRA